MPEIADVRALAAALPRSYEVFVRGRVKFRVGQIVYLAFSRDETLMGFAFPKEEREALLETSPDKYLRPKPSDLRYHWVVARLDALDHRELRELVLDAWRMVVPKRLAALSDEELLPAPPLAEPADGGEEVDDRGRIVERREAAVELPRLADGGALDLP